MVKLLLPLYGVAYFEGLYLVQLIRLSRWLLFVQIPKLYNHQHHHVDDTIGSHSQALIKNQIAGASVDEKF
jgi:hypothetical protein